MDPDTGEINLFKVPQNTLGLHVLYEPKDTTGEVVIE